MFSNIKGLFSSNYVGVVTRHRDAICVRLTFSHLVNIFSPQPDYEQQLIEESRFRQQLEARNNKSTKNDSLFAPRTRGAKWRSTSQGLRIGRESSRGSLSSRRAASQAANRLAAYARPTAGRD